MSTRSNIAIKYKNGKYDSIYCHWDGYPSVTGKMLFDYYRDPEKVKELISLGGISYLEPNLNPKPGQKHSFNNPAELVTVAYHRDRGEDLVIQHSDALEDILEKAKSSFIDYLYVFDEESKSWTVTNVFSGQTSPLDEVLKEDEEERVQEKDINQSLNNISDQTDEIDFVSEIDRIMRAVAKENKTKEPEQEPDLATLGNGKPIPYSFFKEQIEYVIREEEFCNKLSDLYRQYRDIVGDAEAQFPVAGNHVVELLEKAMNLPLDDSGYSTLAWWLYEADMGRNKKMLDSFELTNLPQNHPYRHPDLTTLDKLYKFLLWEGDPNNQ